MVYGGFAGITDGVGKAWISALAPPEVRGHAQGLFQGLAGAGILVAGLWAGLLWTAGPGSGVVPLLLSGAVAAGCAIGLWLFGRRLDPDVAMLGARRSQRRRMRAANMPSVSCSPGQSRRYGPDTAPARERQLGALPDRDDLTARADPRWRRPPRSRPGAVSR